MDIYKFENIKNVFFLNSCNGKIKKLLNLIASNIVFKIENKKDESPKSELEVLKEKMRIQMQMQKKHFVNSLIIVTGGAEIGFNNKSSYDKLFEKINEALSINGSHLVFVRGNNDNPSFFDGKTIEYSNVHAVPDYSVLEANSRRILCVGGGISADRNWRKRFESFIVSKDDATKRKIYWEDEAPYLDKDAIAEIAKSGKIDVVVSHIAPSFLEFNNVDVETWAENDSKLMQDIKDARTTIDRVLECLRDNSIKPILWVLGHYNFSTCEKRSDVTFRTIGSDYGCWISLENEFKTILEVEKREKKRRTKKKANTITDSINPFDFDLGPAIHQEPPQPIRMPRLNNNDIGMDYPVDGNNDGIDAETRGLEGLEIPQVDGREERYNRALDDALNEMFVNAVTVRGRN